MRALHSNFFVWEKILENFLYGVLCNIFLCVRIHSKFFVRALHSNFLYGKKCMAIFCMVIFCVRIHSNFLYGKKYIVKNVW